MDLEAKLNEAESELQSMQTVGGFGVVGAAPGSGITSRGDRRTDDAIPRPPAKFTLTGHRSPITRVLFHPHYNVFVSASEDASIKVNYYYFLKWKLRFQNTLLVCNVVFGVYYIYLILQIND